MRPATLVAEFLYEVALHDFQHRQFYGRCGVAVQVNGVVVHEDNKLMVS